MNQQRDRIVFNKHSNQWITVAQTAAAHGKGACSRRPSAAVAAPWPGLRSALLRLSAAIGLAFGLLGWTAGAALAQVVANHDAPGAQRPTIVNAANGVPLVNIQTPSAAGVSRNAYSQFDVGGNGVILNNSRTNVQTQLGGYVQGNPWLATGSAKVIVNEVSSPAASQLNGYVEVGGQRADVIIANPSGITVNGGGFINAAGVTLTTGAVQYGAGGSLAGFNVQGGRVTVNGSGLDASGADYTQILARAAQIGAGLWAGDLKVITGVNNISADGATITPGAAAQGPQPAVAIDVSLLGGMYAGKIFLLANEAGVGVSNAGTIGTTGGSLTLNVDGKLTNSGTLMADTTNPTDDTSHANLTLQATAVDNSGAISARQNASINADQTLQNAGLISAGRELLASADVIDNSAGTLNAQRLDVTAARLVNHGGKIQQSGTQDLSITAGTLLNSDEGGNTGLVGAQLPMAGETNNGTTISTAPPSTSGSSNSSSSADSSGANIIVAPVTPTEVLPAGQLRVVGSIDNAGGQITASGATDLGISSILVNNGAINVRNLQATGQQFSNDQGQIQAQSVVANASALSNQHGQLQSFGALTLQGDTFVNLGGTVIGASKANPLDITLTGTLNNQQGLIQSAQTLNVQASDIDNSGTLSTGNPFAMGLSGQRVNLTGGSLGNTQGRIDAAGEVQLNLRGQLTNSAGRVQAGQDLGIAAAAGIDNRAGALLAQGNALLDTRNAIGAGTLQNDSGAITAQDGNLTVHTGDLSNLALNDGTTTGANAGSLYAGGNAAVTAGLIANGGTLAAKGNATIQAQSLVSNTGATLAAGLNSEGSLVQNAAAGSADLSVSSAQGLIAQGQNLAAGNLSLTVASGDVNVASSHTWAQNITLTASGGNIDAGASNLGAANQASLNSANKLITDSAQVQAAQIALQTANLSNRGGQLLQSGQADQAIVVSGGIDNTGGTIASNAAHLSLASASLTNTGGSIEQTAPADPSGTASLSIHADILHGAGGTIQSNNALELGGDTASGQWDLRAGLTQGQSITATLSSLDNGNGGRLVSAGNAVLNVDALHNDSGAISTAGDLRQTGSGAMSNIGGTIVADGSLALQSQSLDNTAGVLSAGISLTTTQTATLTNTQGQLLANQTLNARAASIDNTQGKIKSIQDAATLAAGTAIVNQGGWISGQGNVGLNAGTLIDNSASGQIQSHQSVQLTAATIDNQTGQVLALQDIDVNAGTGKLNNQQGLMQAGQTLSVQAGRIDNSNTANAANPASGTALTGLQGNDIRLTATNIVNAAGEINAGQDAQVLAGVQIDNTQGLISALNNLLVQDSATGSSGVPTPVPRQLQVINNGGTLTAGQDNTVIAHDVSQDGALLAGRDLTLDQSADIDNDGSGRLAANRNLTLTTAGDITNSATLQAGAILTLNATNVSNAASGTIGSSGADTVIRAAGNLTNRGLINGAQTQIDAGTAIDNLGTGRIYGNDVSLQTQTLTNAAETVNGLTTAGVIAARQDLDIGAQTIVNREDALLFSGADMRVGGMLADNLQASGQAQSLTNSSAQINASGNLTLNADNVLNTDAHFATVQVPTGPAQDVVAVIVNGVEYDAGQYASNFGDVTVRGIHNGEVNERRIIVGSSTYPFSLFPADVSSWALPAPWSGQFNLEIGSFGKVSPSYSPGVVDPLTGIQGPPVLNYPYGHPIWALFAPFGVTAPLPPPNYSGPICATTSCTAQQQADYNTYETQLTQYYNSPAFLSSIARLDSALNDYNASIDARKVSDWYVLQVSRTQTETQIDTSQSRPAQILAGGNITGSIPGNLINDNSQVIAGGALKLTAGQVQNTLTQGHADTTDLGTLTYTYVNTAVGSNGGNRYYDVTPVDSTTTTPSTLSAAVVKQYQATGGVAPSIAETPGSQAAAGGQDHRQGAALDPSGATTSSGAGPSGISVIAAADPGSASASASGSAQRVPYAIRTLAPNNGIIVSNNSLYRSPANPQAGYLIETDPAFTNYQQWLGSDYMLKALGIDPATMQKRLGDGYYEQQMVLQQVAQLTGRRFVGDYSGDQQQYQGLMDAGITFAQAYSLSPGVALTDAQVAALTSDIVWLVNQTVTLPDGTVTTALVPKVYACVQSSDLQPSGALLSGTSVDIRTSGDLVNTGSIQSRHLVSISGQNISNLDGGVFQAQNLLLSAQTDINNIGATMAASQNAILQAGNDINIRSTTVSNASTDSLGNTAGNIAIARLAALYVSGGSDAGALAMSAGHDVNLQAAMIADRGLPATSSDPYAGAVSIAAGRNVELSTVQTGTQREMTWDASNHRSEAQTRQVGTLIQGNNVGIAAQSGSITARAAQATRSRCNRAGTPPSKGRSSRAAKS